MCSSSINIYLSDAPIYSNIHTRYTGCFLLKHSLRSYSSSCKNNEPKTRRTIWFHISYSYTQDICTRYIWWWRIFWKEKVQERIKRCLVSGPAFPMVLVLNRNLHHIMSCVGWNENILGPTGFGKIKQSIADFLLDCGCSTLLSKLQ